MTKKKDLLSRLDVLERKVTAKLGEPEEVEGIKRLIEAYKREVRQLLGEPDGPIVFPNDKAALTTALADAYMEWSLTVRRQSAEKEAEKESAAARAADELSRVTESI